MNEANWSTALARARTSGVLACVATAAMAAYCGKRDSGSALAPIAATSHIVFGATAAQAPPLRRHLWTGLVLNGLACVFWATLYERTFGSAAEQGRASRALLGGGAVSALAYVTDYHVVPSRLTPGWEKRVSPRSLALIYVALAASLPLRGFAKRMLSPP